MVLESAFEMSPDLAPCGNGLPQITGNGSAQPDEILQRNGLV